MKRASIWGVVAIVALAVCASNLFAAEGKGKKKAGAKPEVSRGEQFKKLDKDGDGSLTVDEFSASLRGPVAQKAKQIFEVKDANKDGKVSLEEFQKNTFEEFALKQGVDPKAGKITLEDMKKLMARNPEMAEKNFKRMDRNGDGVITKEDFAQAKKGGGKRGKKAAN